MDAFEKLLPEALPAHPGVASTDDSSSSLLVLPSEMLACVASFLSADALKSMRLSCRPLCRALDFCMRNLTLQLCTVAQDPKSYVNFTPSWVKEVNHLELSDAKAPQNVKPFPSFMAGCSPVALWVLIFGPQLCSIESASLKLLPYMNEALFALKAACPGINSLEVVKSPFHDLDDVFWFAIAGFANLKKLMFQGWVLRFEDLCSLESLTGLEELHIKRSTNHPTGLQCLSSLTNLRSITLEEIEYPGTILQEFCGLARLTKLESVRFITVGPLADEIEALCHLTRLRTLEISQHHDEALVPALHLLMCSISSLEVVNLPQFELTDSMARHLARQPNLTSLVMGRCKLTAASVLRDCQGDAAGGALGSSLAAVQQLSLEPREHAAASSSSAALQPQDGSATTLVSPPRQVRRCLLPSVRKLSLRCQEAAVQLPGLVEQQQPQLVPLSAVFSGLEELNLQQAVFNVFSETRTAELFSAALPLQHLTSLTTFAQLMGTRTLSAGCPHIRHLSLESCFTSGFPVNEPAVNLPIVQAIAQGGPLVLEDAAPLGAGQAAAPMLLAAAAHPVAAVQPAGAAVQPLGAGGAIQAAGDPLLLADLLVGPPNAAAAGSDGSSSRMPVWLRQVSLLTELKSLDMMGCQNMQDEDCAMLACALPHGLTELKLSDCPRLGDQGLLVIGQGVHCLTSLTLCLAVEVTAKGIVQLVHSCPSLRKLHLDVCAHITPAQCNLVMQRFIGAGRRELDIVCTYAEVEEE